MGIKRMLWRSTATGRIIDTVKNIKSEKSLERGIKKTLKEDYCEDNPITSAIYKEGCYDGDKDGYIKASVEYEKKLLDQAKEFISQKQIFSCQIEQYNELLIKYEKEIKRLRENPERTEHENEYLNLLSTNFEKLTDIGGEISI